MMIYKPLMSKMHFLKDLCGTDRIIFLNDTTFLALKNNILNGYNERVLNLERLRSFLEPASNT